MMALFPPSTFSVHPTGPQNGLTQGIPFPQLAIGPFFTTDSSIITAAPLAPLNNLISNATRLRIPHKIYLRG
jgi:hypothetical protein